jgi:hypothetical protein
MARSYTRIVDGYGRKLLILRSVRVLAREWMVGITFDHRYPFFGELAFGHSVL